MHNEYTDMQPIIWINKYVYMYKINSKMKHSITCLQTPPANLDSWQGVAFSLLTGSNGSQNL